MHNSLPKNSSLDNDRFVIEHTLGRGGFAFTYLAKNRLGKKFAIKEFFPEGIAVRDEYNQVTFESVKEESIHSLKSKFRREGEVLLELENEKHPNIVKANEIFEGNQTIYLVLEYIKGPSLKEIVENQGIPTAKIINKWILQISSALSTIHSIDYYHLDLKPSNIIINPRGEAVLIDFGLSKKNTPQNVLTSIAYSESYAPPEQKDGSAHPNEKMDIYALGGLMLFSLTGKHPVETQIEAQAAQLQSPYSEVIIKAMNYNPKKRHSAVYDFIKHLQLEPPSDITISKPIISKGNNKSSKRNNSKKQLPIILAFIAFLVLAVSTFSWLYFSEKWPFNEGDSSLSLTNSESKDGNNPEGRDKDKKPADNDSNSSATFAEPPLPANPVNSEAIEKPDATNTNNPTKPKFSNTWNGIISSAISNKNQHLIELQINLNEAANNKRKAITGICKISDASNPDNWVKLNIDGFYDMVSKRIRLNSGARISGNNFEYCSFYAMKSYYKWGSTSLDLNFYPNISLNDNSVCRKLGPSTKIKFTNIQI